MIDSKLDKNAFKLNINQVYLNLLRRSILCEAK